MRSCRKIIYYLFFFYFTALVSTRIYAMAFILHPHAGLQMGEWSQQVDYPSFSGETGGGSYGYHYGIRTDFAFRWFFFAPEYRLGKNFWNYADAETTPIDDNWQDGEAEFERIGLNFGIHGKKRKWAIWLGYNFSDQLTLSPHNDPAQSKFVYKGKSYKLGVSIRFKNKILRHFVFQLEFISHSYEEVIVNTARYTLPSTISSKTYQKLEHNSYVLSIVFPMRVFGKAK